MNRRILFTLVLAVLVALFLVAGVHAAEVKLTASDAAEGDDFGWSVAINGNYAIVGAHRDDDKGSDSGSAYSFFWDGTSWEQQQKLTASDGSVDDWLGCSVALDGSYAIVGACLDDDNGEGSGSAYIFFWNGTGWEQQQKLTASDGFAYDYFGHSVALDGNYAIVGAHRDDNQGSDSGSAYIFFWNGTGWEQQQKLTASDGSAYDYFGNFVAIDGSYAIVGAYSDDDQGSDSGSAYIFFWNGTGWEQQQKLTASDGSADDDFGHSVAIEGNYAIVGAHLDDDNGDSSGSAYIFFWNGTGWEQQQKLTASDGSADDDFGRSVAIEGNYAIVGAYLDDDNGDSSGSAYVYDISGEDTGSGSIPEFSTIAIPIAALLGLVFLFSRRRGREE